ncbi:tetratricopeptide repeat protein [Gilvimarinus agarilyticus]|uniref:tetratricopeptide repeat protein n=1 Tax=Gilvimarinus sp. 2_MG-2023 TaxID=3062666 RepID=UPI001C08B997|nr:tetratricopeptide repeat protein [Gilvimarinus sp. 2_MG-2023]MBU2886175.1 tetratricopeptide repeat protein [Gilvimarinus agarilyticus]MDO6570879.1 tetratricopeptide repeat protein [Gilvimarinus sp. 2_MG-2023]
MKPATPEYVLGDFGDVTVDHYGDKSRFFRRDDTFLVETTNAKGDTEVFEIAYTFGVEPLQQYLIAFPDGRLQALSLSWDSRPESEGGQRWFHLYPDERIPHDDALHWTGTYFNWNSRCAHCHSTNLEKNYDEKTNSYDTRWSEINVACEACHGPGQSHVEWAKNNTGAAAHQHLGFNRSISAVNQWLHSADRDTAQTTAAVTPDLNGQLSTCGSCHSRRMLIDDPDKPGHFFDKHQIESLTPPLYHSGGQIRDEVYVMGSFLQSKMYQKGVVCSNCHEPHSLKLRAEGNAVCAQCHKPSVFDTEKHHHHPPASSGAQCANCHMPETTYMVVDPRRDHSIRIPRPDLSVGHDTPNACTQCHQDQTNVWAANAMEKWLQASNKTLPPHYGEALAVGHSGAVPAQQLLSQLANNAEQPGIVRGTALSLLSGQYDSQALKAARANLGDEDPLVRLGAVRVLAMLPIEQRIGDLLPMLSDPRRVVRLEATRLLHEVEDQQLNKEQLSVLKRARQEYLAVLKHHADTPSGQVNLSQYHVARGQYDSAEKALQKALVLAPYNLPATMGLADLYRVRGQDAKGEPLLRAFIKHNAEIAGIHHSLGLLLIRQKRYEDGVVALARAAELEPNNIRFGYVYAVALTSRGHLGKGVDVLEALYKLQPDNQEVLFALLDALQRSQQWQKALVYAEKLQKLEPDNPQIDQFIRYLQSQ